MELGLPHISAYNLIYEEGTPLDRLRREGLVRECGEELSSRLFELTVDVLTNAGYEQYEISNFARNGEYALHNTSYWQDVPYLGLGPSAHSYDREVRRRNISDLRSYIARIETGCTAYETERLDNDTRYNDRVITSLRTMWGLDLDAIAADFGEARRDYCLHMARPHHQKRSTCLCRRTIDNNSSGLVYFRRYYGRFVVCRLRVDMDFFSNR